MKQSERVAAVKIGGVRRKAAQKFWVPQQDHRPLRLGLQGRPYDFLIFHVAAQEGGDSLGQFVFAFAGVLAFFGGEEDQAQDIALA